MIDITRDTKSNTWVVTKTDSEGFHHQISMTSEELDSVAYQWKTKKYES